MLDPNCSTPVTTLAFGTEAEDIRRDVGIMSGYTANVNLAPTRRRELSGRALAGEPPLPSLRFRMLGKPDFIETAAQKEIYTGTPITLHTLVFVLDFSDCSSDPRWRNVPVDLVQKAVLNATSDKPINLQNYYQTCFGDKVQPASMLVVGEPIRITCTGSVTRPDSIEPDAWDSSSSCNVNEQQAWEDQARTEAAKMAETDPQLAAMLRQSERRRDIFILPPAAKCGWAGYGDVTCTSAVCSAFVKPARNTELTDGDMQVLMHEALHNFGLEHAQALRPVPADPSDVMGDFGAGAGLLCPCAPHMYRIGMATPISLTGRTDGTYGNVTSSNFTATGTRNRLVVPAAGTRDDNMIVVNLCKDSTYAPSNCSDDTYFLSYRVTHPSSYGYDSGLPSNLDRRVLVHTYSGTKDERDSWKYKATLLANLTGGASWSPSAYAPYDTDSGTGGRLVVSVVQTSSSAAVVNLCRASEVVEVSCIDGIDNDCNGAQDGFDSACQPPPPPPPPSGPA